MNQRNTHTIETRKRSGAGGAHLGYGMFGARGPLREEEGSGGGSPAPAAAAPAAATTQPGTAPAEGKTFTQEQVNEIAARAREDGRRSGQTQQPAAKPTTQNGQATPDLRAELEEMKQRNAFDKRAAKLSLDAEAEEKLFKLYRAENPQDPATWFDSTVKAFGLKANVSNPSQPNTAAPTEPVKPPAAAPSSSQPSVVNPITTGGLVDVYTLTPEQFAAMTPQQIREHHEKAVTAAQTRIGAPPIPKAAQRR